MLRRGLALGVLQQQGLRRECARPPYKNTLADRADSANLLGTVHRCEPRKQQHAAVDTITSIAINCYG